MENAIKYTFLEGDRMGWDGMGWDGMGWDGMGWDGMGWNAEESSSQPLV